MPKPLESLSILESASAELVKIADQIQVECGYLKSCVADDAISSRTLSAGPHGDTSAPVITGLTDGMRGQLACEIGEIIRVYLQGPNPRALSEALAMQCVSCVASVVCASGGDGSPPRQSPQPPVDWHGEYSDPTRGAAPSAPIHALTRRDLRDVLLTVAGRVCGSLDKYAPHMMEGDREMWRSLVISLTESADRLSTTT